MNFHYIKRLMFSPGEDFREIAHNIRSLYAYLLFLVAQVITIIGAVIYVFSYNNLLESFNAYDVPTDSSLAATETVNVGTQIISNLVGGVVGIIFFATWLAATAYISKLFIQSTENIEVNFRDVLKIFTLAHYPLLVLQLIFSFIYLASAGFTLILPAISIIFSCLLCLVAIIYFGIVAWTFYIYVQALKSYYDIEFNNAALAGCLSPFLVFLIMLILYFCYSIILVSSLGLFSFAMM